MPWYFFALICTFFIGMHLIASKKVLVYENSSEYLAVLAVSQFLVLLPLIPFVKMPPSDVFLLMILQGAVLTIGLLLQFSVLQKLPISTVAPLNNLTPLFLFSFAFFILGESITNEKLLGLIVIVSGAYLIDYSPKDILNPLKQILKSKYQQYLIIALMLLASVAMMDKIILANKVSIWTLLFFSQLFLAITSLMLLFLTEKKEGIIKAFSTKGGWVLVAAMLKNLGNLAYFKAVSLTFVSLALPFRQLASLFAAIIGGTLFKEKFLFRKSLACLIMVSGVLLIIL